MRLHFSSLIIVPDMNSSPAAAKRDFCAAYLNAACGLSIFQKSSQGHTRTFGGCWKWVELICSLTHVTWPFYPSHQWSNLCKAMQALILLKIYLWANAFHSQWCDFDDLSVKVIRWSDFVYFSLKTEALTSVPFNVYLVLISLGSVKLSSVWKSLQSKWPSIKAAVWGRFVWKQSFFFFFKQI